MSKGDTISSSLAGLSLLVALFFAVQQTRLQNRVTAIEESRRRDEVDARLSARVTARIKDTPDPVLVLTNYGPAEARSVGFTLSAANDGSLPTMEHAELLPLSVLHPDVPMYFPVLWEHGNCSVLVVKMAWIDDASPYSPHEKNFKLTVF
jgi:hypothetical protein